MIFDYIYYRFYRFFVTRGHSPQTSASLLLSLVQFLTLFDILSITQSIYYFSIPSKYYFLPIIVAFAGLNWYRYERKFNISPFADKWDNEDNRSKTRRGWLICVYVAMTFLFPFVHGILKQNLIHT